MGTRSYRTLVGGKRLNRLDSESQPPLLFIGHLLSISSQYIVGSYDNLKEVLYLKQVLNIRGNEK